jgi:peptidoglycan/xylan/chitin deacetylase (PgdA/CDA1 family)
MYHHVGRFPWPRHQRTVHCHVDRFARQMAWLAQSALSVISMDRALEAIEGRAPLSKPSIVLTFDDGFQDFYDYAWPILKSHNFPATVFAISDRLGMKQDWPDLPLYGSRQLMDAATLRLLANEGLDIGGHTATHPRLHELEPKARDAEIRAAKKRLEDTLSREVRHFAYPFGDYDNDARERVAAAGFYSAVTTVRRRADLTVNAFEIPRICISNRDGWIRFLYKASRRYNN